jgi:hypothetical protein
MNLQYTRRVSEAGLPSGSLHSAKPINALDLGALSFT